MGAIRGSGGLLPAGVIVALIVWMMPQAMRRLFSLIWYSTWLIAAGDFCAYCCGVVEMAVMTPGRSVWRVLPAVFEFFLPVLAGNIVGGTDQSYVVRLGSKWR